MIQKFDQFILEKTETEIRHIKILLGEWEEKLKDANSISDKKEAQSWVDHYKKDLASKDVPWIC